jgi:hypothetical protein
MRRGRLWNVHQQCRRRKHPIRGTCVFFALLLHVVRGDPAAADVISSLRDTLMVLLHDVNGPNLDRSSAEASFTVTVAGFCTLGDTILVDAPGRLVVRI